jgi:FkbM family methyltransferase
MTTTGVMPLREVDTPWGRLLAPTLDRYVGFSLLAYGEFSPEERAFLEEAVTRYGPGAVVLDVGANIGALTIPLATVAAHVHAFEPQPPLADVLAENVARAGLTNVTVHRCAVGAVDGTIRLPRVAYDRPNNFGGLSMGGDGYPVPLITIDGLHLDRVDLIKMDVEGAELDALAGAADTIERCRPHCYVEADREEQVPGLLNWFAARHYIVDWHRPPLFDPANHAGNPFCAPHLRNVVSVNIWCTPT